MPIAHTLQLSDGQPGGLVVDLMSAVGAANAVGVGLARDTLAISPPVDQLLTDPAGFSQDGQAVRGLRRDNRIVEFRVHLKGVSQSDAQAYLDRIQQIAKACQEWVEDRIGAQPRLKYRPGLTTRAYYLYLLSVQLVLPTGFGGLDLMNNRINDLTVRLTGEPDLAGYWRPLWDANAFTNNLNRTDSIATEGVDLKSGNYVTASWNPAKIANEIGLGHGLSRYRGAVLIWFRYEWNNGSDGNTRCLFTTDDGGTGTPMFSVIKDNVGKLVVNLYNGTTTKSINLSQSQVNAVLGSTADNNWYGCLAEYGRPGVGLNAYLFADGYRLGASVAAATQFGNGNVGATDTLPAKPASFRVGADTSAGSPLNCEVDAVHIFEQAGFEIPTNPVYLPFTRDRNSMVVKYPRQITNLINPANAPPTAGQMQTYVRHVPGQRRAKVQLRVRAQSSHNLMGVRLWASRGRLDFNDFTTPFVDTSNCTLGTGWSGAADSTSYNGATVAIRNSGATADLTNYAWAKTVNATSVPNSAGYFPPGTYRVYLRAWTNNATNMQYKVAIASSPARISTDTVVISGASALSVWRMINLGVLTIPIGGVRPGGTYAFTVEVYAYYSAGTTVKLDGVLFVPVLEYNPALALALTTNLPYSGTAQQIECYGDVRPDTFRVNQTAQTDAPAGWSQTGRTPELYPLADNRLWCSVDTVGNSDTDYPLNPETAAVYLDGWVSTRDAVPR
jgi:hypothetical protein